jgi:asparagine synthase (glutamine-hydrolysing)
VFGCGYSNQCLVERDDRAGSLFRRGGGGGAGGAAAALPLGTRGRNHLIGFSSDLARSVAHVNLYFDVSSRRRLLGGAFSSLPAESWKEARCPTGTPLQAAAAADFTGYLVDDILVKVDRASMLSSLEVRAPFLDPRLIEFAFARVPDSLRATPSQLKVLPRRLAARLLPAGIHDAPKRGFTLPLDAWFRGSWGDALQEVLAGSTLLDRGVVRELFEGQRRGRNNTQRLFSLALLELWRREYGIQSTAERPAYSA